MKTKKVLLVLIVLFQGLFSLEAQTLKNVTRDPESFKTEVADLLMTADKKESKPFVEENWNINITPNAFEQEQWNKIYDITDFMIKKRIRAIPYLMEFAEILTMKSTNPAIENQFEAILASLWDVQKKNKSKDFQKYLESLSLLYKNRVFYKSHTVSWSASSGEFELKMEEEPLVEFKNVDLKCYAKGDSSVVHQTSGVFYPYSGKWVGTGGTVDWQRAGLNKDEVYAEIDNYTIQLKSPTYRIDSIRFHHFLFKKVLMGRLDEKILANVTPENADYPRFNSYENRFNIKNIVDNVDYSGGFTMKGGNFNGFGDSENPSHLYFKYKGKTRVEVISDFISMTESSLGSSNAKIIIRLGADTIVHPGLQVKFIKSTRLLTLYRSGKGLEKTPFYDSYHNFNIYTESIKWNIDDPIIDLGAIFGSSSRQTYLESVDFFSKSRFNEIMGQNRVHPLTAVQRLSDKMGSDEFSMMDLAAFLKLSPVQTKTLLFNLSIGGFLRYNPETEMVVITPKLSQYINANKGAVDYDVIEISSNVSKGDNASIDLENNELTLVGVRFFTVSDSNKVVVFPSNGTIVFEKNRDLKFGGVVYAGKFEYFGSEYYFDYEEFTINLIKVDSARIKVPSFDPEPDGSRPLYYVTNVLEGIRGAIFIDDPSNKSGLKSEDFANYPIFDCVKDSYVYYDHLYNGVYNKEDFYYQIPPFKIDSLETFKTENLSFDGNFISAGIFEDIDEPLIVMRDYSLGFIRVLPEGGQGIYSDIATFDNQITLSGDGLQGNGSLMFFTSISHSEAFTFFPDSTLGKTDMFVNEERSQPPEVPEAHAAEVLIGFYPFKTTLLANVFAEPISMYNGLASLRKGNLALSTDEMGGDGTIEFSGAELSSKDFVYSKDVFDADTSDFSLNSITETGMAFRTEDVSAHVSFIDRIGEFKANGDESFVEFPVNEYICFMDKFNWYMDNNDIELETNRGKSVAESDFVIDTDVNKSSSNFFSTNEDQDSLNFLSPRAVFNINTSIIRCEDIPFIKVADAQIYPDSGKAIIRKHARIDKLLNAGVLTNDVTKYHTIYNAEIEISSRFSYGGSGYIDYVDVSGKENQIWLKKIAVDTVYQTVAEGVILSDDAFMLSPFFEFQGDIDLEADRQFLVFNGSTRILHDCPKEKQNWIPFTAEVDPEKILIPVPENVKSITGDLLASGLVARADPFGIYPEFLSKIEESPDVPMSNASGFITYDDSKNEYQIASAQKLLQRSAPGNFVGLNVNSCQLRTDGKILLGVKFKPLGFDLYGTTKYNDQKDEITLNTSMLINFHFNDDGMKLMMTDINQSPIAKGLDLNKSYYEKSISQILGQTEADKLITDLNLSGTIRKFPDALSKTIYFASVSLYWDDAAEAFKSKGLIGIANLGKKQVFKSFEGKIMITRKRSGDRLEIYFETDENRWYYFSYSRGIMQAYSSNKGFNNSITEAKDDKRILKGDKDTGDFEYIIASRRKKDNFLDRFEE